MGVLNCLTDYLAGNEGNPERRRPDETQMHRDQKYVCVTLHLSTAFMSPAFNLAALTNDSIIRDTKLIT